MGKNIKVFPIYENFTGMGSPPPPPTPTFGEVTPGITWGAVSPLPPPSFSEPLALYAIEKRNIQYSNICMFEHVFFYICQRLLKIRHNCLILPHQGNLNQQKREKYFIKFSGIHRKNYILAGGPPELCGYAFFSFYMLEKKKN